MPKIRLLTSDNQVIEVEEEIAFFSMTIKNVIEDTEGSEAIPLPNVPQRVLQKIIKYCKYHVEANRRDESDARNYKSKEEIEAWDAEFVKFEDIEMLYRVLQAANYLDIKSLMDLLCKHVASMMKGKTPEEIRKTFNIENDFTPEEEEEVRRENQWAYE
nr:SKP1/ASK1 target protein binding component, putative kinetochore protein (SKP1/snRK) [Polytomella parva]|mmetsp:Transcript_22467/g.39860  ORF Transcript_22467/g.39860 Transcript_22467/m.39860 type:complete len:159 (-) Transcript_22467:253-729(-)|eukprot:CAMPEP_0175059642 /NCGR_PEP_ID=MMETSP0052_2-20121109/12545_1 /TAXON_ID=51329 ORGANISM="Polytomella parva, Strain SAG 63-3" /NCGR_SAMPLE_ID=MMETSP0052_2 /ASSEMBLY_ACC=CAM_ASM_000194 /LENGTH=158 /DNA_ID=CAMNT_0016325213 /DNA_START=42 /DNA_END=518 /DNA_ORIENTATION=-